MLRRARKFRWAALAATLLLAGGWILSHYGTLWIAPQVGNRIPLLMLMSGIAQVRLDPLPSLRSAVPPPVGFSAAAPAGVFVFH